MSRLGRLLPSLAAGRRTYSFFSSKPGGGRYFNSAKPPKAVTQAGSSSAVKPPTVDATTATSETQAQDGSSDLPSQSAKAEDGDALASTPPLNFAPHPPHPALKHHDFKLHHFFAMHRPYLLINQPTSVLFESPPQAASSSAPTPATFGTIDDPPEASPDADADAARQLSRALVINRVGNSVDWDETLRRLGLDVEKEPLPMLDPSVPMHGGISMDSVKRKRRRKMNKHKLKKRRRRTRALKIRLGK